MVKAATIFGILLIGNGLYGYMGSEVKSVTALIPAFFGIAILLCGFGSALNDGLRKHLMHFSAIVALLGALASGGRLFLHSARKKPIALCKPIWPSWRFYALAT